MNSFLFGFGISFLISLIILLVLKIIIPFFPILFGHKKVPLEYGTESTEWLNFILNNVLTHFEKRESLQSINDLIARKLYPHQLMILSLGNAPHIEHVATLKMQEPDDIRLLIPIEVFHGPSVEYIASRIFHFQLDLLTFSGKLLAVWAGSSQNVVEIRFVGNVTIDFNLSINFLNIFSIQITDIPLIGSILKAFVSAYIGSKSFSLSLPRPSPQNIQENSQH